MGMRHTVRGAAEPPPNCAKRLECVELAPALRPARVQRKRQQVGRSKRFARQFIPKNPRCLRTYSTIALATFRTASSA